MIPLYNLSFFLLVVSLIASTVTIVILKNLTFENKQALFYFSGFFWLIFLGTILWGFLTNFCYLLAVHFMLIGYLNRYSLKLSNTSKGFLILQWIIFTFIQLANTEPNNHIRIIDTHINMGIITFIITILIYKNGNMKNMGEKIALLNAALFTIILLLYSPFLLSFYDFQDYMFQVLIIFTFIPMLFYSSLMVSYLNDQIIKNYNESITDSMTGLFNRRYFMEQSARLLSLSNRQNTSSPIMMCDIDKFKNINDTYGHDVGDKAIIEFSNVLQRTIRQEDLVARFGGEEFVILMPTTSLQEAQSLAERLRTATENISIEIGEKKISFTASFGISDTSLSSIEEGIKLADEALYRAKNSGRNKVSI